MKHAECVKCAGKPEGRIEASTSREMKKLQGRHMVKFPTHRSFKGVKGWGNGTIRDLPKTQVKPQVVVVDKPLPAPKTGLAADVAILQGRVEYLSNQLWDLREQVRRLTKKDEPAPVVVPAAPVAEAHEQDSHEVEETITTTVTRKTRTTRTRATVFGPVTYAKLSKSQPTEDDLFSAMTLLKEGLPLSNIQSHSLWREVGSTAPRRAVMRAIEHLNAQGRVVRCREKGPRRYHTTILRLKEGSN